VPLSAFQSYTIALLPDESHTTIRRTFDDPFSPAHTRRQFCGYCGTQLSSWNERTSEDAENISLTLGSLLDEDLSRLEEWGLMPASSSEDEENESVQNLALQSTSHAQSRAVTRQPQGNRHRGAPWFEEMVRHTPIGRIKRQKGGHASRDGSTTMEWEVVEVGEDGDREATEQDNSTQGKRKRGTESSGEVPMRSV